MSETKFTLGPWTTVRLKDGDFDSYVVGHKRGGIAEMILCSDYQKETADANARLMAAAPELYEALVMARNALSSAAFDNACVEITTIDAALAKARGER